METFFGITWVYSGGRMSVGDEGKEFDSTAFGYGGFAP